MTYELIYPDGQETVQAALFEARVIAKGFVDKDVEHLTVGGSRKTYTVKAAHFDPTRGIVITTTTGETFVHVGLKEAAKRVLSPRVAARPPHGNRPTCTCGKCKTCRNREHQRSFHKRKKTKAQPPPSGPKAKPQKRAAPKQPLSSIPVKNVLIGIAGMFRAGMSISEIAGIFEVQPEFIEGLLREAF